MTGTRRLLAVAHTGSISGAERVLLRYLDAARSAGWEVACAAPSGPLRAELSDRHIGSHALPELKLPAGPRAVAGARLASRQVAAATRLRRAARGCDLVLVNGLLALPAVAMCRMAAPVCWLVHDIPVRGDMRAVARSCARAVDHVIAPSVAAAELPRRLGRTTAVVRNGTVWPVEPRRRPWPDPPIVGINAVLTSWKGQHLLLEAAAALPSNVTVELMGGTLPKDGDYAAGLRSRAARPDLAGRVRFLGHVSDPLQQMRSWTVAVSASVDPEAAPLAVLEAMSLGVPMVGTDHGGTPEVLTGAGLLVPPSRSDRLAAAIEHLLGDVDLRERLGCHGRQAIAAGLTLNDACARFNAAIERMAS